MGSGSDWKTFSQETPSDREVVLVTVHAFGSSWVDIGTWYDKLKTVYCESDHYATDLKTSESRIAVAWMKIPDAYQV